MTLVLCHLDMEVMLDIDTTNKDLKDIEFAAKWLGEEELCRAKLKSAEVVPSIEALPKNWKGALPYREDRSGPELTCDQILLGKGNVTSALSALPKKCRNRSIIWAANRIFRQTRTRPELVI